MSVIPHEIIARRQFNDLQPISRLPLEILLIVFRSTEAYEERGRNYEWTKVLHVCHRWYTVGMGSAILWDTLTHLGGLECVRTMLERSQGPLLNVTTLFVPESSLFNEYGHPYTTADRKKIPRYNQVSHALLQQMPRIQTLEVTASEDFWKTIVTNKLPCKLTKLTLNLVLNTDRPDQAFNASSDWLFSSPLPDLRELRLNLEIHARGVIRASGLRVLHVSDRQGWISSYTPRDLIESMRHMPLLEEVSLKHVFAYITDKEYSDRQFDGDIVRLPKIKSFEFLECDPAFSQFLRCVAFPATAQLNLGCDVYDPFGVHDAVTSFREKLTAKPLDGLQTQHHIQALSVRTCHCGYKGATRSLRFEGCIHRDHSCFRSLGQWCESPTLAFTLSYVQVTDLHDWDRLDGFAEILELLPLTNVEAFHINSLDVYHGLRGLLDPVIGAAGPALRKEEGRHESIPRELKPGLLKLMPNLKTIWLDLVSTATGLTPASDPDSASNSASSGDEPDDGDVADEWDDDE